MFSVLCSFLVWLTFGLQISEGERGHKINIIPVYHSSIFSLRPDVTNYIKCHLVDAAVTWLHEVLSVEEIESPLSSLLLDRDCPFGTYITPHEESYCRDNCSDSSYCGPIPVHNDYTKSCTKCSSNTGVCYKENKDRPSIEQGTHFILHVGVISSRLCLLEGVVTDGGACQQDPLNDRPTVGYLNFCSDGIDTGQYSQQVHHVLRELLEALAFSHKLLPFFRSSSGEPFMPRTSKGFPRRNKDGHYVLDPLVLNVYIYTNWTSTQPVLEHSSKVLRLPTVVREARKHFNCSTLNGLLLEDQSHGQLLWESRVMLGDIMTNSWLTRPVISSITLALLEDSGWYQPDYRYAGILTWGKGEGCGFITSSCADVMRRRGSHSFCDNTNLSLLYGCTPDYSARSICSRQDYQDKLPLQYQYFKFDSHVGGGSPLVDYCPLYDVPIHSGVPCDDAVITAQCDGKKCVEHHGAWNVTSKSVLRSIHFGASCFKITCTKTLLKIFVGGEQKDCKDDQTVSVNMSTNDVLYSGELICPPYKRFCHAYHCVNYCSGNGRCIEGFCFCYPGYYGVDCNLVFTHRYINYCSCYVGSLIHNGCGCYCNCLAVAWRGLTGYDCSHSVPANRCTAIKCRHGRCARTNEGRGHMCICDPGFSGNRCDNCRHGYVSRKCDYCPSGWKCYWKGS